MLRFDGVSKRYGGRMVLRDLSLVLEAGCVALLVGANGAGKSTLLRLAAGLTPPTTGTVILPDPADTANTPGAAIGYLGHGPGLYPGLSALENLTFWQRLYGADARPATLLAALDRVGLAGRAHDRAATLSRGMLQRLNLARLLALRPGLLLLDEPDTGLDAASSRLLDEEIMAARNRGAAVIWASHRLERDRTLADRVIELAERRIRYDGPPDSFLPDSFAPDNRPC